MSHVRVSFFIVLKLFFWSPREIKESLLVVSATDWSGDNMESGKWSDSTVSETSETRKNKQGNSCS